MAQGSIKVRTVKDGSRRYDVIVYVSTDPPRQSKRTFKTRKEAEKGRREWLDEIENGTAVERSRQTVAELLRTWLDGKRHDLKPTTLESYERTIEREIIPALGGVAVQTLTAARLKHFCTAKRAEKKARGRDGARCVQLCHMRLSQALDDAVRLGLVARNVADAVTPPRVVSKTKETWEPAQMRRFLAVAAAQDACGHGYGPLWVVIAATGMRRGEALGLRWVDLDEHEQTLRIAQQVNAVKGAPLIQRRPKSDDSARIVPVDAAVITALKRHRVAQNERRLQAEGWQDHGLIFCTGLGKALNPNNVLRDYYTLAQEAGLPSISIHGLRHSYATLAIESGEDIKAVSENLGHASVDITLRTYHHPGAASRRAVASTVGAALFGAPSEDDPPALSGAPSEDAT